MNYLCVCDRGQVNRWNKQVWEEDREEKYWKWLWKEMMWEEREQVLSYLRSHGKHHGGKKSLEWIGKVKGVRWHAAGEREWMRPIDGERERERGIKQYLPRERERERGRGGMGGSPEQKGGGGFIWPTDWSGNVGTYWWVKGGDVMERTEREREDVMKISWMQYQIALQNLIWNMAVKEKYPPICTLNKVINK